MPTSKPTWRGCWPRGLRPCERRIERLEFADAELEPYANRSRILGAARYRLGQYDEAKRDLLCALKDVGDEDAARTGEVLQDAGEIYLFLAMVCCPIGQHEEAHRWLAQADAWIQKEAGPEDVHLRNLRREADDLLNLVSGELVLPEDNGSSDLDLGHNRLLVAEPLSKIEVRISAPEDFATTALLQQRVTINRDGQALQPALDYQLDYDSQRRVLTILPRTGQLANATYRISIRQTPGTSDGPSQGLMLSIDSRLSPPGRLFFRNGRDDYASGRLELHEAVPLVPQGAQWRYLDDNTVPGPSCARAQLR